MSISNGGVRKLSDMSSSCKMSMSRYTNAIPGVCGSDNSHDVFTTRETQPFKTPYITNQAELDDDADYGRPIFTKPKPVAARATYIKTEPGLDDDHPPSSSRVSIKSKVVNKGGYLAKKSAYINELKRLYSSPDMLHGNCFETTGFVIGPNVCLEVSHMLIDSGASSSIISTHAVRKAGLSTSRCEPVRFETCDNAIYYDKYTTFDLVIAGVSQTITAYIDEVPGVDDGHILLGVPALKLYDMRSNHCFGNRRETRWSISQNVKSLRRKRYVLRADSCPGVSTMHNYPLPWGLRIAMEPGETAKERDARETLERRHGGKSRYSYHSERQSMGNGEAAVYDDGETIFALYNTSRGSGPGN